jgi:glyoxylase-like metal-dependent hydrolase (beta-lactamase superfamily II)
VSGTATGTGQAPSAAGVRIERIVTAGQFRIDGGVWDVENNVWIVGNDRECIVIDAAHDEDLIAAEIAARDVRAILCTHAHNDHINAAAALATYTGAPILLHPADEPLWQVTHPDRQPDGALADGAVHAVAGVELRVLHTPGHSPGGCSFYAPALGAVFSGDTLFAGGPGGTGRSYSDFDTLTASIRDRLLPLPADTMVLTGHGVTTTIGAEAANADNWAAQRR